VVVDGANAAKDIMSAVDREWLALRPMPHAASFGFFWTSHGNRASSGLRTLNSTFIDQEQRNVFDLDGFG
jgi:hypothetical protein